ncbi:MULTISPECIES: hypothetical protein [Sphingobacterium]|nr:MULTISPECIES: hypothetical protein [Sphingobacterium]
MRIGVKNYWTVKGAFVLPLLALTIASAKSEVCIGGIGFVFWKA